MSPYFLKREDAPDGKTHIFEDAICECDGKEHTDYPVVRVGLMIKLISCKKCLGRVGVIVEREFKKVLENL